jgi:hypothetical protein
VGKGLGGTSTLSISLLGSTIMTDEEMFAKLEAILLKDQEQQMNFPFQAMDYPIEDNNQYLMFG